MTTSLGAPECAIPVVGSDLSNSSPEYLTRPFHPSGNSGFTLRFLFSVSEPLIGGWGWGFIERSRESRGWARARRRCLLGW